MVELGDLWAGETRKLVIGFGVPAKPALGLAAVADLELRFVALPAFAEETLTITIHVNVVPGDAAAGRIADAKVRTELVYQQAQQAKRRSSEALRDGDGSTAAATLAAASARIDELTFASPGPETAELDGERAILDELRLRAAAGETEWAAKFGRMDQARKSRTRGRADRKI